MPDIYTPIDKTSAYLHPFLRRGTANSTESAPTKIVFQGTLGPYLDIYALGVVSMQMLTGEIQPPRPLTEARVEALILQQNPFAREASRASVETIADLIVKMLSIQPGEENSLLEGIARISYALSETLPDTRLEFGKTPVPEIVEKVEESVSTRYLDRVIREIRSLSTNLSEASGVMLRTAQTLKKAASGEVEASAFTAS